MRLVVLYQPNSEHATQVETFLRDFEPQIPAGVKTKVIDLNTHPHHYSAIETMIPIEDRAPKHEVFSSTPV